MVEVKPESTPKQCALRAAGHLKKAALLTSLLEQTLSHIESLLSTVVERSKKIIKRLDFSRESSAQFESGLRKHETVLGRLESLLTHVATETVTIDSELSIVPECLTEPIYELSIKKKSTSSSSRAQY